MYVFPPYFVSPPCSCMSWFMGMVYFCLDVMQNNAYIIYHKQGGTLDHKMFVLHLAAHLREKAHAPAPCR